MHSDPDASPVNPLPPVVVALAVVLFGIEVIFQAGARGFAGGPEAVGWRLGALNAWAFSPEMFERMLANGQFPWRQMARIVAYPFVHYGFSHLLFVLVFLLALGKMVGEVFSGAAVLIIFFGSAIAGALVYTFLLNDPVALVGGYPAVYGLIGAYTFILWVGLGASGGQQYQAFTLIAFLLGIQLLFGLLFGGGNEWVAEVGGFAAGFALSFVVSPGGWRRVVDRVRRR